MANDKAAEKTIFIICPIGARGSNERKRADQMMKHLIEAAYPGYSLQRSDLMADSGSISHQIVSAIQQATLVIADMTGHNPNVFYEMAIAHGFRRPIVHMIQDGEPIPFDLTDMRALHYDLTDPDRVVEARALVKEYGDAAMANPRGTLTPLSQAAAFSQLSEVGDVEGIMLQALFDELRGLRVEVQELQTAQQRPRGNGFEAERVRMRLKRIITESSDPGQVEEAEQLLMELRRTQDPDIIDMIGRRALRLQHSTRRSVSPHEQITREDGLGTARKA